MEELAATAEPVEVTPAPEAQILVQEEPMQELEVRTPE